MTMRRPGRPRIRARRMRGMVGAGVLVMAALMPRAPGEVMLVGECWEG